MDKTIFFAILTRNHLKFLPNYFRCLEEMDYDKKLITIYINTNNNDDDSVNYLSDWISKNYKKYKNIIFEKCEDDPNVIKGLDWSDNGSVRLKKMAKVRNRSLDICRLEKTDYYFVMDTDNWVCKDTLKDLIQLKKPIVAPFIKVYNESCLYSNYFCATTENGYHKDSPMAVAIWRRENLKGTFKVPLVHCTYLIDCNFLNKLSYTSDYWGNHHYEFVIFSNIARKNEIDQYICNEKMYGFVNYYSIIDESNSYELMLEKYKKDNKIQNLNKITN